MIARASIACGAIALAATSAPGALDRWLDGERDRDRLPGSLVEASGLARDDAGHVWIHDDERGIVARLADGTGDIAERRVLGPDPVRGDFEGLAWDGRRFHLVTSTGTLVSFEPGVEEGVVRWSVRRTGAADVCEVEGLETAPGRDALVLACKTIHDRRWRGHLLLLEVALPGEDDALDDAPLPVRPRVAIPSDVLEAAGIDDPPFPSGVTRAPGDGWLIVDARRRRVLQVSDDGRVVDHARLPAGHPQAEGIVLEGPDLLTLADEGDGGRARITRYARPPNPSTAPFHPEAP
ncbi:MAG: hypothetical protein RLN75_07875 [Longimicrobiales bacterium]